MNLAFAHRMIIANTYNQLPVLSAILILAMPLPVIAQLNTGICPVTLDIPPRPYVSMALQPGDIFLTADEVEYNDGGISILIDNAEMANEDQQVSADRITYDQSLDTADFEGNVNVWDKDIYMQGSKAHINIENNTGYFNEVSYWLLANRGRGFASEVYRTTDARTVGSRIDYTTCDPDQDADSRWNLTTNFWKITARELSVNHETDRGTGKHVVLKVKDIPVFYTPYISFPTSDRRKSGFLFPAFGASSRYGFELETPYYWNIAPQMDATLTPRLLSNSGVMLEGEYRYLFTRGVGILNMEYLPSDKHYDNKDRGLIDYEHRQSFLESGYLELLYKRVSDSKYFQDFGSSLFQTSNQFLEQNATISYAWNIDGHYIGLYNLVGNFQTVDDTLPITSLPYKRLPSTTLAYFSPYRNKQLRYELTGKLDYFTRSNDPALNSVNGIRYDIFPLISWPVSHLAYFVTPKAGLRFTRYQLEDNNSFDLKTPDRLLPFVSLDSGIFMEKQTSLLGKAVLQTLEPRLYYLYIPRQDQTDLPVFDTGLYGETYAALFYPDRFSAPDRMGDANQITLAVTSRLYSETTGQELGYASLGQIVYLADRTVVLPGQPVQNENVSALISEVGTTIIDNVDIRGEIQWNPDISSLQKLSLNARYEPEAGKVVNLGYRMHKPAPGIRVNNILEVDQSDVSFAWPVKQDLSIVGRWNYAVEESKTLDFFTGVEYNSCCWGVRAVARRFLTNLEGEYETGFFLQFQLKGLAGMGEKTVDFLTMSIPGYLRRF
jgi:LPS-assembly protein